MRNITFDGYDMHSLKNEEYLPCLVELMWADPELAITEYSQDEIAWVKHNVFKDRPIIPWHDSVNAADSVKPPIDLSRLSVILQKLRFGAVWEGR